MVKPFQFAGIPNIKFGPGKLADLPGIIKSFGQSVILVAGKESFISSSYFGILLDSLESLGIKHHIVRISGEPSPGSIDQFVKELSREKFDLVASIGGGSVIDAGKAISAMMYKKESVVDYLEGVGKMVHPGSKIPFIALPTTAGTGSEATKNAVISSVGNNGFKRSLRHDNLVPDIAIVDPELTLSCPDTITAASGMDCFTQLLESYLSDKANVYTDALAMEGLKAIKVSLIRSYLKGDDIEARTGMAFAALTSGICLANAGLGVVHGFASSIGGLHNVPHGVICGTIMAKANEVNVRVLRKNYPDHIALKKYTCLGRLFLEEKSRNDDYYIDGFIRLLYEFTDELKLPGLNEFGITEKNIGLICRTTETKNNPVKLTSGDLEEIISARLF